MAGISRRPRLAAHAKNGFLCLAGTLGVIAGSTWVAPAPALAAHGPFHFRGTTSQGLSLRFNIPYSFSAVTKFSIHWKADCTSGATILTETGNPHIAFNRRNFGWLNRNAKYSYTRVDPGYSAANGRKLKFAVTLTSSGHIPGRGQPHGTWSVRVTVTDPSAGQTVDTCTTGKVTWKAHII